MRGHIRKRGNTWEYTIDIGKDKDNKRRQKSKSGFKTKREAEKAMAIEIAKIEKGEFFEASNMTVCDYMFHWLDTYAKVNVAPSTCQRYKEFSTTII